MNEFYLYGPIDSEIGWWEETVSAKMLSDFLAENKHEDVTIRVNSLGGQVYEGIAMCNMLKAHKGKVTAVIDGACMSAATMVTCGADTVQMNKGAVFMIHDPSAGTWISGTGDEMRTQADKLINHMETLSESVIDIYAEKSGATRDEIKALMETETYYTAEEAVAAKWVDSVLDYELSEEVKNSITMQCKMPNLSKEIRARVAKMAYNQSPIINKEPTMNKDELIKQAKEEQKAAELARREAIQMAFKAAPASMQALKNECLLDMDCDVTMAKDKLLEALTTAALTAEAAPNMAKTDDRVITPNIDVEDPLEKDSKLILMAWENRAQGKFDNENPMANAGIHNVARMYLQHAGVNPSMMGDHELIDRALSIRTPRMAASPGQAPTDFPMLLQEFVRRVTIASFRNAPQTYKQFTTIVSLNDFRATEYFSHGISQTLGDKDSEGNYPRRKLSDAEKGSVQAKEKGAIYSIKRASLINDDLGAIANQFNGIGSTAGRSVENAVYAFILSNPTLTDGKKLFDKTRGNILEAAPMTAAAWEAAKLALANQKAINTTGDKNSDEYLDLRPELLLTSVANESKVRALNSATVIQPNGEAVPQSTNGMFPMDRVITTQRLDGKGSFYFAPKSAAPNITAGFVGSDEPTIVMLEDFLSGDPQVRVQLDFGLGVQNYRGVVFAPHGEAAADPEVGK